MDSQNAPWLAFYGDVPKTLDYPNGSMCEAVLRAAEAHPKAVAYEFQGKKTSYEKFARKIEAAARAFVKAGVRKGDRVVICMPNTPQSVDSFYALNRIGAVPVMIHPLSAVGEIAFYIKSAESKAILVLDLFYEKVKEALCRTDFPVRVITAKVKDELSVPMSVLYPLTTKKKPPKPPKDGSVISYKDFLKAGRKEKLPEAFPSCDDTGVILFSGGTTGTPKGVLLSNFNINAMSVQTAAFSGFSMEGMRMLSVLPIFHGFGLGVGIHTPLIYGATCILVPTFSVKTYAKLIKSRKPNVVPGVPTLFEALLRTKGLEGYDLSDLRGVFCGGDPLSVGLKKKVDAFLKEHNAKVQIREGYGATECVAPSCLTPRDFYREGSIGIPYPDTFYTIADPRTNEELPPGTEGEICISGPTVMQGYMHNPEETANALRMHRDGRVWLHTGDMGEMDEDGFVYFRQRLKRLIVVSGYNVYPSQVENVIDAHPDVLCSCAVGVPDPYKMHRVKVYVVLKPGAEPSGKIREELLERCRKNIARFALPRDIEFLKELPRTRLGKVDYRRLEEAAKNEEKQ